MFNYILLILSLFYTTFLSGFVFIEIFYHKLKLAYKVPLYFVMSVVISSYFTYFTSQIFGFNKVSVSVNILLFLIAAIVLLVKRKFNFSNLKKHKLAYGVGLVVYLLFFVSLNAGIFKLNGEHYIMSGPNWQDTAMHLSIIESISEGNFPPQAPYFSGQELSYYYFADFHSAIVSLMSGKFFPQVLVLLNPFFAAIFFLVSYTIIYFLSKNSTYSIAGGLMAVFYGNFGYLNLLKDVVAKGGNYFDLLTNNGYHLDFESTLQMVPMSDYFLQNRPMMVGLVFVSAIMLLLFSKQNVLLIGIINASLIKFQFFAFVVGFLLSSLYLLLNNKLSLFLKKMIVYTIPSLLLFVIFGFGKAGERSVVDVVLDTFSWGAWQTHQTMWYVEFVISNFNLSIFLFVLIPFFLIKIRNSNLNYLVLVSLVMMSIPFLLKFTIYEYDMFKFFYFATFLITLTVILFSLHVFKQNKFYLLVTLVVLISTVWTSINTLIHAYLNKSNAYSISDYDSGLWVRENTPQKSVFITYPSVHNAATDIAGRLRILSYINWPHSHGFNEGVDNVFTRDKDIIDFFENADDEQLTMKIMDKYNIDYVYYGSHELSNFPEAENKLESNSLLIKVYDQGNIKIFERLR